MLQNTLFKDLLLFGHDLCAQLIAALINMYLGDNACVDSISNKLRLVCPSLYKTEDAAYSKVSDCDKYFMFISFLCNVFYTRGFVFLLCLFLVSAYSNTIFPM